MLVEFNSVYGYIQISERTPDSYNKAVDFIKSLGKDETFPPINTNMFSFGDYEFPYYYDDIMFGFACTYKYFGDELEPLNRFVLKIENILRNVDFDNAQFHIKSPIGMYTMYWQTKVNSFFSKEKVNGEYYRFTEAEEWYFGFGKRSPFNGMIDKYEIYNEELEDLRSSKYDFIGFKYPIPKK